MAAAAAAETGPRAEAQKHLALPRRQYPSCEQRLSIQKVAEAACAGPSAKVLEHLVLPRSRNPQHARPQAPAPNASHRPCGPIAKNVWGQREAAWAGPSAKAANLALPRPKQPHAHSPKDPQQRQDRHVCAKRRVARNQKNAKRWTKKSSLWNEKP